MDAVVRASEWMRTPIKDVPPLAVYYAKYLGNRFGMCDEIWVTAFAHYAQIIEGLPCEDDLYQINDEARDWFAHNQSVEPT